MLFSLPCIMCDKVDPLSGIVCECCICVFQKKEETFNMMCDLVIELNNLTVYNCTDLHTEVREKVQKVYDTLCQIKISEKEEKDE